MLFHVLSLKYGLFGTDLRSTRTAARSAPSRRTWISFLITWFVYPLGILASCFHLANGFWTAAITWGLTISRNSQRRWGMACAGLFVLTFVAA
jgi:succinate dehydrogenase / fumarate reductase cytochrome b subunit